MTNPQIKGIPKHKLLVGALGYVPGILRYLRYPFPAKRSGVYQYQWSICWLVPLPSNSHHQDSYFFKKELVCLPKSYAMACYTHQRINSCAGRIGGLARSHYGGGISEGPTQACVLPAKVFVTLSTCSDLGALFRGHCGIHPESRFR